MTTRLSGNFNLHEPSILQKSLPELIAHYSINKDKFASIEQVHGNHIDEVNVDNFEPRFSQSDGLVCSTKGIFLGVNIADCIPVFFYEPQAYIWAIAHAGWRGTQSQIVSRVVTKISQMGGSSRNLHVVLGPHIGACCYVVSDARAQTFLRTFDNNKLITYKIQDKWRIDLAYATAYELRKLGVPKNQTQIFKGCTSCQDNDFFSFRREQKNLAGEMLGVIGTKL